MTLDWNAVGALLSAATLVVTCLIFSEARSIRRTEWLLRQNQAWNDLGSAVAQLDPEGEIGRFLLGGAIEEPDVPRHCLLVMSYFNVVSSEYHALAAHSIPRSYVINSFTMTAAAVCRNTEWVFRFLGRHGYEPGFIRALAILAVAGDDIKKRETMFAQELGASPLLGRLRGRWSPRIQDGEVERLCAMASDSHAKRAEDASCAGRPSERPDR
jgi:hypothetical protein